MKKKLYSYKDSGVNISLGNEFVNHISKLSKKNVKKANKKKHLANIGSFSSLYDINSLNVKNPVIVSCTDGVGTKLELSDKFNKLNTIGIDLVAMCVNDLIVQGAKPLFFLYIPGISAVSPPIRSQFANLQPFKIPFKIFFNFERLIFSTAM